MAIQQSEFLEFVAPATLKPHPLNVSIYGEDGYQDLVESVKELGVLQALYVTSKNIILSGHRRWHAAVAAECPVVPIIRMDYTDELDERQAIIEHNRYRVKTGEQMYNEGKELEKIEAEKARQRQLSGLRHGASTPVKETFPERGQSRDAVAKAIGLGSGRQWGKLDFVGQHKPDLLPRIKPEGMSLSRAYTEARRETAIATERGGARMEAPVITGVYCIGTEPFTKLPHVSRNSGNNEWYTPAAYIKAARQVMGSIDVDPASSDKANETVEATTYYTIETDGRKQPWRGNVWMNPPYAQPLIAEFCDILLRKYRDGEIRQACVLVNNATETIFYQDMLRACEAVCFIKGRVKFIDEQGDESGAPLQGQTVLYFGHQVSDFGLTFGAFGVVLYGNNTRTDRIS